MKKCLNGDIVDATEEEILIAQNEELAKSKHYFIGFDDAMRIIANNIKITLPNNEEKPLSDIVNTSVDLPFKVGYRWELQGTSFVLVKDENALGTQENPIIYTEDVQMFDNAFYKKDGKLFVYMSGELIEW